MLLCACIDMYNGVRCDAHGCLTYWDSQVVDVHMYRYCVIDETGGYAMY